MKIISIASGSSGNCTLVMTDKVNILIDAGLSMKKINNLLMLSEGIDLEDIDVVLCSHVHQDHLMAVHTILNKYEHIKLVTHQNVIDTIVSKVKRKEQMIELYEIIEGNNVDIDGFFLSHDVPTMGFTIFENETNESLCFLSDNGMYPYKVKDIEQLLYPHTYYMIESNYSILEQYFDETRHEGLKRRVLSNKGHGSNLEAIEKAVKMLQNSDNNQCKGIMFHHLSKHCNNEELAIKTHQAYIGVWGFKTLFKDIKFKYAKQDNIVEL